MKSFTVVHVILLLLFLLAYQCTNAQDYLITVKGDSLTGSCKLLTMGREWRVQLTQPDKTKTTFSVLQTREFSYKNEVYHPVKFKDMYVFMKLIKKGYLSLYAFQQPDRVTFDGRYLLKKDLKGLEVPNLGFKKVLSNFLSDCESVSAKISDGAFGRNQLNDIIDEYNACLAAKSVERFNAAPVATSKQNVPASWDQLETKIKEHADFDGKADALEMVVVIKEKLSRGEKIPGFITGGLKPLLAPTDLKSDLDAALKDLPE